MSRLRAYSRNAFVKAVFLSALTGWAAIGSVVFWADGNPATSLEMVLWFWMTALFIALLSAWVFVAPVLWLAMRKPISWTRAAILGAAVLVCPMLIFVAVFSPQGQPYTVELGLVLGVLGALMATLVRAVIGPGDAP